MTLDFSCVKQEETSPLAIQTTCSYSSRVPYNREESSSPSILFLLSLFFSFKGKRALTGIETLYLCVMQTNQFLRPRGTRLCWLELQTYPSKCAYTHTHTHPPASWERGCPHVPPGQQWQTDRQAGYTQCPRHSGWVDNFSVVGHFQSRLGFVWLVFWGEGVDFFPLK